MVLTILVTGCAGYMGAICSKILIEEGFDVVGLDNLSRGFKENIPDEINFYKGCISDRSFLKEIFKNHKIELVIHFAAFIEVKESVENPELYKENNFEKSKMFFEEITDMGVKNIIFSSSAAVYGIPENPKARILENSKLAPINPYGKYKLEIEKYLEQISLKKNSRFIALRYFNVAGAYGNLGECHQPESHLIPLVLDTVLGQRESFSIYGNDYPTPDGTAVRDYIHVEDLVRAHISAIDLFKNNEINKLNTAYNLGYGKGYSVNEIVKSIEKITMKKINLEISSRRAGDPPSLIADSTKAMNAGFFKPKKNQIDTIIKDAYAHRLRYRETLALN